MWNFNSITLRSIFVSIITHIYQCHSLFSAPDIRNFSINVTGISNTSIDLQWLPPKSSNGIIRDYIVNYYLDDAPQHQKQQDLIDLIDEQNFIFVQRNITVHDTKVRIVYIHHRITYLYAVKLI